MVVVKVHITSNWVQLTQVEQDRLREVYTRTLIQATLNRTDKSKPHPDKSS